MILANQPLNIVFKSLDEARQEGAMALFGEKYGDTVRTITIHEAGDRDRFSYELCGGTHVRSTGEIGPFIITREESSSAGVRRIEAMTGAGAQALIHERLHTADMVAARLRTQPDLLAQAVDALLRDLETAQHRIEQLERQAARSAVDDLLSSAVDIGGARVVAAVVRVADADLLAEMADLCRDRMASGVVVLGAEIDGKVRLAAKVTADLVKKGVHAGKLVGEVARMVGGGGGGRPDFATAGGREPERLAGALAAVEALVAAALK
jgi:alanyl-tRNA synthetase